MIKPIKLKAETTLEKVTKEVLDKAKEKIRKVSIPISQSCIVHGN